MLPESYRATAFLRGFISLNGGEPHEWVVGAAALAPEGPPDGGHPYPSGAFTVLSVDDPQQADTVLAYLGWRLGVDTCFLDDPSSCRYLFAHRRPRAAAGVVGPTSGAYLT